MVDIQITTLGQLKSSGYVSKSIKEEMRYNLIKSMNEKKNIFEGIFGFDKTVIPDLQRAILSRHSILLLGLRGQAKTKIARLLVNLLDEYIPYITGTELNDDPLKPISKEGQSIVESHGDTTPISWMHRNERYVEKLATPDVSVADLIGDVDPIKAATLKLPYSDERVIHFGLIPRAHRSIFVINELPDLQARIQVSLFNILQEGDIQIRGFKVRLPLDVQFVFTANPEDYTNRGSIITPLKDRIESQILTHYPSNTEISKAITKSEAKIHREQKQRVRVSELHHDILEKMVEFARSSDLVDSKSGVSARLSISALENLVSNAERRAIINQEQKTDTRISDFLGIIPAMTGKIELVYEGEQEGTYNVALKLINEAIKHEFLARFPHPEKFDKGKGKDPYGVIRAWFSNSNQVGLANELSDAKYREELGRVAGLRKLAETFVSDEEELWTIMELILHGLAEFEVIGKSVMDQRTSFSDPLAMMFDEDEDEEDDDV